MPRDDLIQYRRGTHAQWETANPVLAEGEVGYTTDAPHTLKIGDGWATWTALPVYLSNESTGGGGGGTGPVGPIDTDDILYHAEGSDFDFRIKAGGAVGTPFIQGRYRQGDNTEWIDIGPLTGLLDYTGLQAALAAQWDVEGIRWQFVPDGGNGAALYLQQNNIPGGTGGEFKTVFGFHNDGRITGPDGNPIGGGGGSALPLTYANDGPEDTTGGEFFLNDRIKFVVRTANYGGSYFDIYARTKIGTPEAYWLYLGEFFGNDENEVKINLNGDTYLNGELNTNELLVQGRARFTGMPEVYDIDQNPLVIATEKYVAEHGQRVFAGNDYDGTSGIIIKDGTFPFTYGPTPSDVNLINDGGYLTVLHKAVDRNTGEPVAGYSESNPWVDHIYIGPITRTKNGDGTYGAMTGGEISMYVYNRPYTSGFSINDRDVLLAGIEMSNVADPADLPPGQGKYKMTNYNAVNLPVFTGVQTPGDLGRNHEVYITVPASDPGAYSGFQQYASSNQSPEIFVRTYYEKHEDPDSSDREYVWSPWVQINKAP